MNAKQLTIDDICQARHKGNEHSAAANASLRGGAKAKIRREILEFISSAGSRGATVEEIQQALAMRYTTVSARCSELKRDELLVESGSRKTSSGRAAAVLVLSFK